MQINYNMIPLRTYQVQNTDSTTVNKVWNYQRELSYIVGRGVKWCNYFGNCLFNL